MYARLLIFGLLTMLLLTACDFNAASVSPTVRGALVPTRMATATATHTPTTEPSATPTATATSTPTVTPSPTPDVPTVEIGNSTNLVTTGELSADTPRQRYTFAASAGDLINLNMTSQNSQFAPHMQIEDSEGNLLVESLPEANARISNYIIPTDGVYRVLATSTTDITTDASFDFSFQRTIGAVFDAASGILLIPIAYGQEITGSLHNEQFFAGYIFTAGAGDTVSIEMNVTSGDLDPYVVLVNRETRQIVVQNDDAPQSSSLNAFIEPLVLAEAGEYIILATRYAGETGTTTGDFILRLNHN